MKRYFIYSVFILANVLINVVAVSIQEDLVLSEHQVDRLCIEINKMKLMSQSDDKIEKFLKEELGHLAVEIVRTKLDDKAKAKGFDYHNGGGGDGQIVDIQSKNMIGEKAMLNTIKVIGTDNSQSGQSFLLNLQESNNEFKSSDVNYFSTSLYTGISVGRRNGNPKDTNGQSRRGPLHSRFITKDDKVTLSHDDCKRMIQIAYTKTVKSLDLTRKLPNSSTEVEKNAIKSSLKRSGSTGGGNSTSIDTEYAAGPDSLVSYQLHLSRGNAMISDSASDTENQVHENLKNSKVTLFNLVAPIVMPP